MTIYKCDQCDAPHTYPFPITFTGYYPRRASGILLPETNRSFEFCSHACAVKWMRWAISHEPPEPAA